MVSKLEWNGPKLWRSENDVIQAFNGPLGLRPIADTLNPIENRIVTKVSTMIQGLDRVLEVWQSIGRLIICHGFRRAWQAQFAFVGSF